MILIRRLLYLTIPLLIVADDDSDTEVQFSKPENAKPLENDKNATTLILEEIEDHVSKLKETVSINRDLLTSGNISINGSANEGITGINAGQNGSSNASSEAKNKVKVECAPRTLSENEVPTVILANSSTLLKALTPATTNTSAGECVAVLFYSAQCIFSARMAPHFNALPRVFPDIQFYAVDAMEHGNLHVRYGLVYVPNVMLFHNAKPFARFNETTLNLDQLVKFIHKHTGLQHNGTLNVTSADMNGPVPSTLTKKVDYLLILAWAFTLCCIAFGFIKSSFCQRIVDFLKNTWQEAAAAQHEHED
ncbi:thioredoxin domain-containing protein 15-like [Stegodyphus dumicola]|uniref:thioredoxin domain-containing protein 15-like n=1 Tax=Stegodyphus dumicola TaxID=202533 RepID=UPI0015B1E096|nr:thioredoxin domain-containing protein 15-like [Stegodyphus dumicola]XP_035214365.1 thioredoxin domain-containing protein 15-like [Stegodyphus dumicola]